MQTRSVPLTFRINFPLVLFVVLGIHSLLVMMEFRNLRRSTLLPKNKSALKIVNIENGPKNDLNLRRVGSKKSKLQTDYSYLGGRRKAPELNNKVTDAKKTGLNLSDLSVTPSKAIRPGTRPEVTASKSKAINAISLKGSEISQFVRSTGSSPSRQMGGPSAAQISGDPRAREISETDILVNLEVPEGVEPDELNKYELMFYGFQRRTAMNYINAFYKNLDKFERANPHLKFPVTDNKQVMTGRLTYDEKGNIKQIKMIRWSNEDRLQDFFEDVLKDMDVLHNPPQALWKKSGEFSIFFSFVVNG